MGRAHVLVVEDEAAPRTRIAVALREAGHEVREAGDAEEALVLLDSVIPDLLILHIAGPRRRVLLDALRTHPIRAAMAILGLGGQHEAADLLEAGADDFLPLPLNLDVLRIKTVALSRLKQAERAARELTSRRARDQHILQRAERRLAGCATVDEALTVAAELVRANLGYDRVSIAHFDPSSAMLRYLIGTDEQGRVYGPSDPPVTVDLRPGSALSDLPAYQAMFGQGLETYYIPDTAGRAPAYFRPLLDGPVRESLLVAMRAGEQVLGLITVDNLPSGRPFGPEDSGLLVTLARHAAVAVERAGLAETLRARAEDAEGLARAGAALGGILDPDQVIEAMLDQGTALLPADFGAVLLCDGEWARIGAVRGATPLPIGTHVIDLHSPGGVMLRNGGVIRVPDVRVDPVWRDFPLWSGEQRVRALLFAPLIIDGELQSILCLASFQARAYDERGSRLIGALAERAAGAWHTARRFKSERPPAGSSSLLPERVPPPPEALEWAPEASAAEPAAGPTQTKQVLENLRVLALMDKGMLRPAGEPVHVGSLVRMLAAGDASFEARLRLTGPDDLTALADPSYTALVLENLLDNARRYSAEDSPIQVTWAMEDRMAVIRVLDQGRGIPAGGRRRLFARFGWTPAEGDKAGPHGVGLSLYLGRALAEAMDGALDLETTSRKGSTFRLSLPMLPD